MDNIQQYSPNTKLNDRILWFDGDISSSPDNLISILMKGISINSLYATEITEDIKRFNKLSNHEISVKTSIRPLNFNWIFEKQYQEIDVEDYIYKVLEKKIRGFSKSEKMKRIKRTVEELNLYKKYSLIDVLKLMIYIVDTFEQNNIVWGVGRGSSVSSYVLYLIGIHDIDSVEFDLPIEDFFHVK